MKVGLLGNMNNNNFALMRYFRDLGVDAHLILYDGDGTGPLRHFAPECDTWEIDRWSGYIHEAGISNAGMAALDPPLSWLLYARSRVRYHLGRQQAPGRIASKRALAAVFEPYDRVIGSGIAPALFCHANRSLDLFYPYASGIEFLDDLTLFDDSRGNPLKRQLNEVVRRKQLEGLRRCRNVLVSDELSRQALASRGIAYVSSAVPMVYTEEVESSKLLEVVPAELYTRIMNAGFTILSTSRQLWSENAAPASGQTSDSKNNHWLLHAFSELLQLRPQLSPLLVLSDYGPDVGKSKALCAELGIQHAVLWLPTLPRKILMLVASIVDVCAGEFYTLRRHIWGGTGWEALAVGKPFLQGFNFAPSEFERTFGYPPPPLLPVVNQGDIVRHLLNMADHPAERDTIGQRSRAWFNRYNGIGLAKRWVEILGSDRSREHAVRATAAIHDV